ncbi:hypothetical protein POL68_21035 [Stigmatella sp. ncwal1]|uniref:Ig-like domain-containing protein n=1 Tax=Stigmatella ashevillensis TaxID=2995309 RepID=A0ABT5DBC1_9BACT|nr:hypothetical protein [Stigmatella ashevillena]MDC0710970.1 hypothetical protein [Stigmatella ashevillena]
MLFARALFLAGLMGAGLATAAPTRQVPEGGRAIEAVARGVICGPVRGGWTLSSDGRSIRPPAKADENSRTIELKVAPDEALCNTSQDTVTVIATGAFPRIDAAATTFFPDDGRVDLRGANLQGVIIAWSGVPRTEQAPGPLEGQDLCLSPTAGNKPSECAVPVRQGLPTDAALYWVPPYGKRGPEVTTYDASGNVVDPETFRLRPGRIVLTQALIQSSGIDLSKGPEGAVTVSHPEAVASVDCGLSRCEVNDNAIAIRHVAGVDVSVSLRLRLAARVFFARGDALEQSVSATLPVLACPLAAVEGTVLRDADDSALVLRLDPSCSLEPRSLLWTVNGERARVERVVKTSEGTYGLLRTRGTSSQQVTITATTSRIDGTVVASTTAETVPLPGPRALLEMKDSGPIDFIPTNRPAEVKVAGSGGVGRFVLRPLDGVYSVTVDGNTTLIQGDATAGGFVSLRFGYRVPTLPAELATMDLVSVNERVQRVVREASVPVDIANMVEFVCADKDGQDQSLPPSRPHRIEYKMRNSCRVIVHRERLTPEQGNQEVVLRINVTKADGSGRGESSLEQRMILRPQGEQRVVPVSGNLGQYDRILVQVSHVADESRYALNTTDRPGLPSAQWTAIVEGGFLRLYTMATIPAGLYRATAPSGQLAINFGVLSRLAMLNNEGQERLVGIEFGLMGLGLVPQSGDIQFPQTLAVVAGLGLRVPIGPGAAVGAQAWVAREFRGEIVRRTNGDPSTDRVVPSSKWSFIFGPSISIGNVGFNL